MDRLIALKEYMNPVAVLCLLEHKNQQSRDLRLIHVDHVKVQLNVFEFRDDPFPFEPEEGDVAAATNDNSIDELEPFELTSHNIPTTG